MNWKTSLKRAITLSMVIMTVAVLTTGAGATVTPDQSASEDITQNIISSVDATDYNPAYYGSNRWSHWGYESSYGWSVGPWGGWGWAIW